MNATHDLMSIDNWHMVYMGDRPMCLYAMGLIPNDVTTRLAFLGLKPPQTKPQFPRKLNQVVILAATGALFYRLKV